MVFINIFSLSCGLEFSEWINNHDYIILSTNPYISSVYNENIINFGIKFYSIVYNNIY